MLESSILYYTRDHHLILESTGRKRLYKRILVSVDFIRVLVDASRLRVLVNISLANITSK